MTDAIPVTIENFARAETDRMFASLSERAGGANRWHHDREPSSVDDQRVIRQNRDTLYSLAVVDIRDGVVLTVPDAGDRYLSVMVVNQDHYINRVFHSGGTYHLSTAEFETPWVLVASRILVDPTNPADVAAVNELQDGLKIRDRLHRGLRDARLREGFVRRGPRSATNPLAAHGQVHPRVREALRGRSRAAPHRHCQRLGRAPRRGSVLRNHRAEPAGRRL